MGRADRDRRAERGVALVEFAFVALLLFALIFGIIGYAYMMSFRQTLTQAAAEGARAGAVAVPGAASSEALAKLEQALSSFEDTSGNPMTCSSPGMTCTVTLLPVGCSGTACDQVQVTASYAYRSRPLLPTFPGLGLTLPDQLRYSATAEIS